jgi:hypothetical protein
VEVFFLVGVAVVMAVVGSPPENALLRRGHGHPGDNELKPAAGLEGAVGEVTVITGRDEEHTRLVKEEAGEQEGPPEGHKEDGESDDMNNDEGNGREDL